MNQTVLKSNLQFQKNNCQVRYVLAVAAGKGGVGKSSVAVNLALTLQKSGYEVGILDADVYGPSLGLMMPLEESIKENPDQEGGLLPGKFQGVKAISLAYLRSPSEALMVRAPVANGLIMQCVNQVTWGGLDYLIVDFPPGTGDIQLTLMQTIPFSGAVLVTTPQEVATLDVQKAAQMFHQMGVPITGVIENMSYFEEPMTGFRHYVFGKGGGEKIQEAFGIPFLGQIPIDPEVSRCGDLGVALPFVSPSSLAAQKFQEISRLIQNVLFEWEGVGDGCLKQFEYHWKDLT